MAFDFDIAIAKLSCGGADYDAGVALQNLAARYPELDFLFHKLEEQALLLEGMVPKSELDEEKKERARADNAVTELTIRWQRAAFMLEVLLKMDAARPIAKELSELTTMATEAARYGEAI